MVGGGVISLLFCPRVSLFESHGPCLRFQPLNSILHPRGVPRRVTRGQEWSRDCGVEGKPQSARDPPPLSFTIRVWNSSKMT